MFRLEHSFYLLTLPILPLLVLLFLWALVTKKKIAKRIGDPLLVKSLISNYSPQKFILKFSLLLVALAAIITGIANLQKSGAPDETAKQGIDMVIALDVSKSMLADDIKPNRLERARQLVQKLMIERRNDRIGIVLFAGRAYLQMPLTTDHAAAQLYIQTAGPDVVPTQGTVISAALHTCQSAFNEKEIKFKAIVLITDGEDHDPEALPLSAQLAENGIMINTVGIGTPEGAPIMDPSTGQFKVDPQGQTVVSKLNEGLLQQLAQSTRGVYVPLGNTEDAIKQLDAQLDTIDKSALEDTSTRQYASYFYWFIAFGLLILVAELFVPERKRINT